MTVEHPKSVRMRISAPKVVGVVLAAVGGGVALACGLLGWGADDYAVARRWFGCATVAVTCGGLGCVTFLAEWLREAPAEAVGEAEDATVASDFGEQVCTLYLPYSSDVSGGVDIAIDDLRPVSWPCALCGADRPLSELHAHGRGDGLVCDTCASPSEAA